MRLENWAFVRGNMNPYIPPEAAGQKVHGTIYGSNKFTDGEQIITSQIIFKGKGFVTTQNSRYELGVIDPEYLKTYPSAYVFQGE